MNAKPGLKNQKGLATLEAVALLVIFVVMLAYGIGMFGVIHSGIINSISARAYAWETMRHRTNVTYFRDSGSDPSHYNNIGFRAHGVISELSPKTSADSYWYITERWIGFGKTNVGGPIGRTPQLHLSSTSKNLGDPSIPKQETKEVNPVWLKTIYGMCLNSACGGVQ